MMKPEEPRFSDDEEQRPLLAEKQLRDTCLYAAAIVVVAYSLGCGFEDCRLDDDGYPWPTATTRIEIKYPEDWRWKWGIFPIVGAIHKQAPQPSQSSTTPGFAASMRIRRLERPTFSTTPRSGRRSRRSPGQSRPASLKRTSAVSTARWERIATNPAKT